MFPKILVLTLKQSIEKNEYIESIKDQIGDFEYFYGIGDKKQIIDNIKDKKLLTTGKGGILFVGQIGCYFSHTNIFKKVVNENLDNIIVFENDINFLKEDWKDYVSNSIKKLPKDYDILLLYSRSKNMTKRNKLRINKYITKYNNTSGLVGYLISNQGAKKIIEYLKDQEIIPIDLLINKLAKNNKINIYNLYERIIDTNRELKSTIYFKDPKIWIKHKSNKDLQKYYCQVDNLFNCSK